MVGKWRHRKWNQLNRRVKASYLRGAQSVYYGDGHFNDFLKKGKVEVEMGVNPIAAKPDPVEQIVLPWAEDTTATQEPVPVTRPPVPRTLVNVDQNLPVDEELPVVTQPVAANNRESDRGLIMI